MFLHVVSAKYLNDYKVLVRFNDSSEGIADFSQSLEGKIFEPLKDLNYFSQFSLDSDLGTLVWPNGADFAPEYLYFLAFKEVSELQTKFEQWGYKLTKVYA
jgi:hypothetical protein